MAISGVGTQLASMNSASLRSMGAGSGVGGGFVLMGLALKGRWYRSMLDLGRGLGTDGGVAFGAGGLVSAGVIGLALTEIQSRSHVKGSRVGGGDQSETTSGVGWWADALSEGDIDDK